MRNLSVSSNVEFHVGKKRFSSKNPVFVAVLILALLMGFGGGVSRAQTAAQKADIEKPLTNTDVITMLKAALGDDIVIAKINQAPRRLFGIRPCRLAKQDC